MKLGKWEVTWRRGARRGTIGYYLLLLGIGGLIGELIRWLGFWK